MLLFDGLSVQCDLDVSFNRFFHYVGQSMEITFDTAPLRTSSLLSRIERPSLAERLGGGAGVKQQGG